MRISTRFLLTLGAVASLATAGCGTMPLTLNADGTTALSLFGADGALRGGKGGPGLAGGKVGHGFLGFPGVTLTAEQRMQLAAIAAKYAPAAPTAEESAAAKADHDARHAAVVAALEADPFDAAAYAAALEARAPAKPKAGDRNALLVEARALLTDEQRAAAIAALAADTDPAAGRPDKGPGGHGKGPGGGFHGDLVTKLSLTAEQQAAYTAATAKPTTEVPAYDPAAKRAAMIAFLQSGDPAALPAEPERPARSSDAWVAFVATLSAEQRALLAAGPVGGPGGPGRGGHAKGGQGGRGGHGGFGRERGANPAPAAAAATTTAAAE